MELENLSFRCEGSAPSSQSCEGLSTDAEHRDGPACSSGEGPVMGLEQRGRASQMVTVVNPAGDELSGSSRRNTGKSFDIPKRRLMEAWRKVESNGGAPGVDKVTITDFGDLWKSNLYKLWNRMSSGSYMPGPVRGVEIPKDQGNAVRILGVPNVADRVAQTAVCMVLEEQLEPLFHPDSYGYRPKRSALDAVGVARRRCWQHDWVIDLDIRAFFDSVPHDLMMKAVAHHTTERWVLLYIERWLTAPMQHPDGTVTDREKGTPQGAPISPLLANLFMHYAFDVWLARTFPGCPFERYADDAVIHCDSETQARTVLAELADRLGSLGLDLHPDKTKIVYCKDANRRNDFGLTEFDFLGYTFRGRLATGSRGFFVSFGPAISNKAVKAIGKKIRAWHLNRRSRTSLAGLAEVINPQVRGWFGYYGVYNKARLRRVSKRIDDHLIGWLMQKYKRLKGQPHRAREWLNAARQRQPALFVHWEPVQPRRRRPVGAV